jgi:hypothetical protein
MTQTRIATVDQQLEQSEQRHRGSDRAPVETPRHLPPPAAPARNCSTFDGREGAERYCASSVLSSQFGNTYGVRNLFNDDRSTAWVEGAQGQGVGEWISVTFDDERWIRSVSIDNGYQKNSDIFYKNSRVRRLRLIFSGGEARDFLLQDGFGRQTLTLGTPIRARWVQFVIDDVYPGRKYTDTAISKLLVTSASVH